MNMVEKILARASGRKVVEPGDVVVAQVDLMVMHDLSSNFVMRVLETEMENASIQDPSRIAFVFDHNFSPATELAAETLAAVRRFAARHGIRNVFDSGTGSVHHCIVESGLWAPGEVIIGCDSHTPFYGALGVFATGVGKQWQTEFGHAPPKRFVTPVRKIDVLAIRQTFHQDRALLDAPIQFVHGIGPSRMDGNAGQKFFVFPGQLQGCIEEAARTFDAVGVADAAVRELGIQLQIGGIETELTGQPGQLAIEVEQSAAGHFLEKCQRRVGRDGQFGNHAVTAAIFGHIRETQLRRPGR